MKTRITLYQQVFGQPRAFTSSWAIRRNPTRFFSFQGELAPEVAAERAFHVTNAPEECLYNAEDQTLARGHRGPSLSVGDVVAVDKLTGERVYLLCESHGWAVADDRALRQFFPLVERKD